MDKKKAELIADLCPDAIVYSGFRFAPGETFQVLKTWKVCVRRRAKPYPHGQKRMWFFSKTWP